MRHEIYIDGGDAEVNLAVLRSLRDQGTVLEAAYGRELSFEELGERAACRVLLFHHTTPESAEQIATSGVYRVGPANFLGPTGVYAGSDDPEVVTLALRWVGLSGA